MSGYRKAVGVLVAVGLVALVAGFVGARLGSRDGSLSYWGQDYQRSLKDGRREYDPTAERLFRLPVPCGRSRVVAFKMGSHDVRLRYCEGVRR